MKKRGFTTTILHSDRRGKPEHGAVHQPVHNSVAWGYDDARDLARVFQGKITGFNYGRQNNPTVKALEDKVTLLEDGVASLAFSTGMGAITLTLLALLKRGDHLISSTFLFGNTNSVFNTLQTHGIEITFVDATDSARVEEAYQENTKAVFVETVANPATQVADLGNIGNYCESKGLLYIVDNTMTSPYLFLPKKVKASLSVNSLTKYIGGHGNALGGSITELGTFDWAKFPNIYDNFRNREPKMQGITQIRKKGLRDFGASLAPETAHHISVGSETLALRMERSCSNAMKMAQFLSQHPRVSKVNYPGLESHPQHLLSKKLFLHFGAIMSFVVDEKMDYFDFLNNLEVPVSSTNLGDNRSLVIPVAPTIFYEMGPERRASMGIEESLIRFSVGIEDPDDLIDDFQNALEITA